MNSVIGSRGRAHELVISAGSSGGSPKREQKPLATRARDAPGVGPVRL